MERSLVIALYLVVCLFLFHTPALQIYLNQRQTIDKYRHIVTAFCIWVYPSFLPYFLGVANFATTGSPSSSSLNTLLTCFAFVL